MWFKVCDKLHSNRKIRAARRGHATKRNDAGPIGVWVLAGSWCGDNATENPVDGFIPEDVVATFDDDWMRCATRLVDAGLWSPAVVDGEPGWVFHDWTDYNDGRVKILTERRHNKMRSDLQRDAPLVTAIKRRDKDRCRYCGTAVDWRNRRGKSGATYDHVKPITAGGLNTLENVVIACKGCNDRKNGRTLKEAGMRLLEPGSLGAPVIDDEPTATPARAKSVSNTGADAPRSTCGTGRVGSGAYSVSNTGVGPQETTSEPTEGLAPGSGSHGPQVWAWSRSQETTSEPTEGLAPGEQVDPMTGEITSTTDTDPEDGAR